MGQRAPGRSGETPGAREAGVIYVIDRALSTFDKDKQPLYLKGIQRLRAREKKFAPHSERFSDLSHDQQIKFLKQIEKTAFFEQVRTHTVIAVHLLGTCRMGNDPKRSVINKDRRAHDVPNLFLCHRSSFVTSGRGQLTCTIQALAFRASDRIIDLAKRGDIKSAI